MGEETELMASEEVAPAEGVTADEPCKMPRKRKNRLYKALKDLMEFYLGDANLSKNRFMAQKINGQPFVYVDLDVFLTFNKMKALTSSITDIAKALENSEILQVSEDGTQVCRKTPVKKKENEMDCTIYVEQLGPDVDHDWLVKVFSEFGQVDYVSLPRFPHNNKLKGFAFVEFRDPEGAKRALEAFCCLPSNLSPEELQSIKTTGFEKKTKKKKKGKKQENFQIHNEVSEGQNQNIVDEEFSEIEKWAERKNKHRSTEESDEINSKGTKSDKHSHIYFDNEEEHMETDQAFANKTKLSREKNILEESENNIGNGKGKGREFESNDKSQKKKKKRKHSTDESADQEADLNLKDKNEEEEPVKKKSKSDTEGVTEIENSEEHGNGNLHEKKRKHSTDEMPDQGSDSIKEEKNEEEQPVRKKAKSETGGEEAQESEEHTECSGKKKRRKRSKVKKEKISATSLGLKVLPKKEWQLLRNKYLAMQREMMSSLKKHLHDSSVERHRPTPPEKKFDGPPKGTVIKVILDEPITNCKVSKSELRIHPEISYVDVTEGSPCVYLRTKTSETASNLVQAKHWPNMEILQGEEEAAYWTKMKKDREYYQSKHKPNHRGRTKLLKRAEMFQGKHMTSFETT